jgi:hypothetical protein
MMNVPFIDVLRGFVLAAVGMIPPNQMELQQFGGRVSSPSVWKIRPGTQAVGLTSPR